MKYLRISLLLAMLLLSSCNYVYKNIFIDSDIRALAYDVLDHPDKLTDVKSNYPQFYDSLVISWKMNDSNRIKERIIDIKEKLKPEFFGYCMNEGISECDSYQSSVVYAGKPDQLRYILESGGKIIQYQLNSNDYGLILLLYKKKSKYYIIDITPIYMGPID